MNSDNFEDYIAAYIDQELTTSEEKAFEDLMESDQGCKVKFDQTMKLLQDIKAMPKLETSPDFSFRLQQKIDSSKRAKISFIDKISNFMINRKPALNFAFSFGAIAVFTFVYLNDLSVFQVDIDSAEETKKILTKEHIEIELAGGIDDEFLEIEDKEIFGNEIEDDTLDKIDKKFKINFKGLIQDAMKEVKTARTFNEGD